MRERLTQVTRDTYNLVRRILGSLWSGTPALSAPVPPTPEQPPAPLPARLLAQDMAPAKSHSGGIVRISPTERPVVQRDGYFIPLTSDPYEPQVTLEAPREVATRIPQLYRADPESMLARFTARCNDIAQENAGVVGSCTIRAGRTGYQAVFYRIDQEEELLLYSCRTPESDVALVAACNSIRLVLARAIMDRHRSTRLAIEQHNPTISVESPRAEQQGRPEVFRGVLGNSFQEMIGRGRRDSPHVEHRIAASEVGVARTPESDSVSASPLPPKPVMAGKRILRVRPPEDEGDT